MIIRKLYSLVAAALGLFAMAIVVSAAVSPTTVSAAEYVNSGGPISLDGAGIFAAVTWNFTAITDEFAGLGTALVAGIGLAIAGLLAFWGVKRAIKPLLSIVSKFF